MKFNWMTMGIKRKQNSPLMLTLIHRTTQRISAYDEWWPGRRLVWAVEYRAGRVRWGQLWEIDHLTLPYYTNRALTLPYYTNRALTFSLPPLSSSLILRRASTVLFRSRCIRRPKSRNMVEPPDRTMFCNHTQEVQHPTLPLSELLSWKCERKKLKHLKCVAIFSFIVTCGQVTYIGLVSNCESEVIPGIKEGVIGA